jgi:hypothetical protein
LEQVLQNSGVTWNEFRAMARTDKQLIREQAIQRVAQHGTTVVAGHALFLTTSSTESHETVFKQESFEIVFNKSDRATYKAILYLDKLAEMIRAQRNADSGSGERVRPPNSPYCTTD